MKFPKDNKVRLKWFWSYLRMGFVWLIAFVLVKKVSFLECSENFAVVFWCLSWGAIGIALGLFNSRKDQGGNTSSNKHYITYFIFVWFISFLSAFVMFGNSKEKGFPYDYASAALVGIVVGFAGDKLAGKIFDLK